MRSSGHSRATGDNQTRLGIPSLDGLVHSLIGTTLRAYTSGKKRYIEFCDHFCLLPLPVSDVILLRFVAHLALLRLSYQTVKLYLSALRHMQIMSNIPDPSVASYPRLNYALRGLRRKVGEKGQLTNLPFMLEKLAKIQWFGHNHHPCLSMSCCGHICLGFFEFMH